MVKSRVGSFFKELMISWKESLKLLIDKRFWLVTIKASKETYTELLKRFWWLIGACIFIDLATRIGLSSCSNYFFESFFRRLLYLLYGIVGIVWFLLWCLLAFVVFLIVRSALEKKDTIYYLSHRRSYIRFVFVTATIWVLHFFSVNGIFLKNNMWWFFDSIDYLLFFTNFPGLSTIYFSPFLVIYTFFYLDSSKKIECFLKRLWSTCYLVFYTYPFCLIAWLIISALAFFIEFIVIKSTFISFGWLYFERHICIYHLLQVFADDVTKLLIPFFIAFLYMLYTKQVHENFDRYTA